MSRIVRSVIAALLIAAPVAAQEKPAPAKSPKEAREAQEKAKPGAETPAPARPIKVAEEGLPVNVRLEITITDQRGDAAPIVKTVTKTVADRSWIRIRTGADVQTKLGFRPVVLNIDSFPRVIPVPGTQTPSNKLKVDLTIDYRPVAGEADSEKSTTPSINESLTIILEDGKPMVISQSADPATDRKVKVEAKATILK